ncbi:15313_t:CDS:1, partial [Dentiscutata heterogama]
KSNDEVIRNDYSIRCKINTTSFAIKPNSSSHSVSSGQNQNTTRMLQN